jgi:hypothetical protein
MCSSSFAGSKQVVTDGLISPQELVPFAKKVEQYAASKGARIFLIARLGSPKSELPDDIEFTHVGLAVYSDITTRTGEVVRGYAIHNLYQNADDLSVSNLVMDYPVDFFMGVAELKAGIIIPTLQLQQKLLASLESGVNKRLHNANYSIIANPYSSSYQNCTEHILDIIFSSIYGIEDHAQIKANEQAYFKPQDIKISPFKRLLAPMLSSEVSVSDHQGEIKTTTFSTIAKFLNNYALAESSVVIDNSGVHLLGI